MLVKDLRLFDKEYFFRNFWRDPAAFELLLSWLAPLIQKSSKRRLTAVTAERLCAPLCYLATGDARFTIASSYRIGCTTLCHIVRETTEVLRKILFEKGYLEPPKLEKEWLQIEKELEDQLNFSTQFRRNLWETCTLQFQIIVPLPIICRTHLSYLDTPPTHLLIFQILFCKYFRDC